jgi:hypothetical protein
VKSLSEMEESAMPPPFLIYEGMITGIFREKEPENTLMGIISIWNINDQDMLKSMNFKNTFITFPGLFLFLCFFAFTAQTIVGLKISSHRYDPDAS